MLSMLPPRSSCNGGGEEGGGGGGGGGGRGATGFLFSSKTSCGISTGTD